jgi:nitroreductase
VSVAGAVALPGVLPDTSRTMLTPDELLTTTRAVRKRLDFDRPVDPVLIDECLQIALQAPTASNRQSWQFVVVTDPALKQGIAEHYRRSFAAYIRPAAPDDLARARMVDSSSYLAERFGEVPVHVLFCLRGRLEGQPHDTQASLFGSIVQAAWSFQLAARARGLGTCYTTLHLAYEREVAELLGLPYDPYCQEALVTVGHTLGGDFKPAARTPLADVVHRDRW